MAATGQSCGWKSSIEVDSTAFCISLAPSQGAKSPLQTLGPNPVLASATPLMAVELLQLMSDMHKVHYLLQALWCPVRQGNIVTLYFINRQSETQRQADISAPQTYLLHALFILQSSDEGEASCPISPSRFSSRDLECAALTATTTRANVPLSPTPLGHLVRFPYGAHHHSIWAPSTQAMCLAPVG